MPLGLARVLSGVFHPLLVPTYLAAALLGGAPAGLLAGAPSARLPVLALVWGTTFVLPAVGTYALVRAGRASSLHLPDHRERSGPLLLALAGFSGAAALLASVEPLLALALWAQAVAVALTWAITRHWLISAHSVAMGGSVGLILALGRLLPSSSPLPLAAVLATALVVAGGVGAARLALKAHTPAQVGAGLALGLSVGVGAAAAL